MYWNHFGIFDNINVRSCWERNAVIIRVTNKVIDEEQLFVQSVARYIERRGTLKNKHVKYIDVKIPKIFFRRNIKTKSRIVGYRESS